MVVIHLSKNRERASPSMPQVVCPCPGCCPLSFGHAYYSTPEARCQVVFSKNIVQIVRGVFVQIAEAMRDRGGVARGQGMVGGIHGIFSHGHATGFSGPRYKNLRVTKMSDPKNSLNVRHPKISSYLAKI